MEERSECIVLHPVDPSVEKLSWESTAQEMAAAEEDWSDWDAAAADGLDDIPWNPAQTPHTAEPGARFASMRSNKKR